MSNKDTMTTEQNPNEIVEFIKFNDPKETVFTTEAVIKHYPTVGTEIQLPAHKAKKWIEKGYATKEAPKETKKKEVKNG